MRTYCFEGFGERPNVVVGESQRLDLGQLRLVGEGRQDHPQLLEGHVEHVHAVALAIIGLGPAQPLQPLHLAGTARGRAPTPAAST